MSRICSYLFISFVLFGNPLVTFPKRVFHPTYLQDHELSISRGLKCHGSFGCFIGMNIFGIDEFPVSPDEIDLQIKLYTRQNRDKPNIFMYNDISNLNISNFNESRNTKMIVHGFGGSCDKTLGPFNEGCIFKQGAKCILRRLVQGSNSSLLFPSSCQHSDSRKNGFSLGAHIYPAGPIFTKLTASKKLDKSDADFVDIIHSNGKPFTRGGLGDIEASGTLDFYPNGGQTQLGCPGFIVAQTSPLKGSRGRKGRIGLVTIGELLRFSLKALKKADNALIQSKHCLSDSLPIHGRIKVGIIILEHEVQKPFCGRQLRITIDYGTEYGYNSLYKGSVTMIFEDVALNNIDNFKILKHFYAPGRDSRVITIEKDFPIEDIYLSYNQNGYGFFINVIKSRKYLRINSVEITDDISGSTSIWALNTTNNVIESGAEEKLFRIPK
ncbi:PNLIP [Lepeophtheirus salmonis]|uniref:PNLIP n=1 Tax=Lepeophtheirus salmonis TaxID=72036 RepID=A0A7R8CBS7_LEPSM|nr:PNLIP [Lepeophtheirus salmonis]CAF2762079.1 PNLIP [Lepeophtheirus salmonis]